MRIAAARRELDQVNERLARQIAAERRTEQHLNPVLRDGADERRLDELLAQRDRLESIGLLSVEVAHDFNNFLAVICGELDIIDINGGVPPGLKLRLANIHGAAESAIALIRDLMGFARRWETARAPIELGALVRRVAHMVVRSLGSSIHATVTVDERQLWVIGNASQLENAIFNLCLNARDAMPAGGDLTITVGRQEAATNVCMICQHPFSGPWAVVTVTDAGMGIPEAIRSRILEPFFTTKPVGMGTGLGLPSVVGCVTAHSGHLTLASSEGAGSRFAIHLPLAEPPAGEKAQTRRRRRLGGRCEGRLLLLDDQIMVRETIAEGLRRLGWTVDAFADPGAAIAAWQESSPRFSAALVDFAMPGMNGAAVFHAIRARDPAARVVLMSGSSGGNGIDALLAEGLAGFVDKPVKLRPLAERLGLLLEDAPP